MEFLAINVDFSSPSAYLLGSLRPAQAGIKRGTLRKSGYFSAVGLSSVKMVADRQTQAQGLGYNFSPPG